MAWQQLLKEPAHSSSSFCIHSRASRSRRWPRRLEENWYLNNSVVAFSRMARKRYCCRTHGAFGDAWLLKRFSSPKMIWNVVNKFRKQNGFNLLPESKFRLAEYNEAVFYKSIKIQPVAIFGYRPETRIIANKLHLPCFISAKEFYKKYNTEK